MKLMKGVFIRLILQNAPTSQAMIETLKLYKNIAKRNILKFEIFMSVSSRMWTNGMQENVTIPP